MKLFRPKIGLALSGGGPKGIAHIGALKILEKYNIPIDYIAGTSAGSIAGSFYAYTKNASKLEEFILSKNWFQLLGIFIDPSFKQGVLKGKHLTHFLSEFLGKNTTFQELQIPFSAVSVDINTGNLYPILHGPLIPAILGSCGAPMLFSPSKINNKTLIDGGIISPVPVDVVRKMGADIVIAIDLYRLADLTDEEEKKLGVVGIAKRSADIMLRHLSEHDLEHADIIVQPHIEHLEWGELLKMDKRLIAIKEGEKAMENKISAVQNCINKYSIGHFFSSLFTKLKIKLSHLIK